MSARALAVVAAALLAAILLLRAAEMGPPPAAPSPRPRTPRAARSASAAPALSTRNVFEFAPRPVAEAAPRPPALVVRESPAALEPPLVVPAVRFVGLVRRGGVLRAALQVHGEPVVLGKGETAGGYTVVAVDEDAVRLRAPDGTTLTLAAGGS